MSLHSCELQIKNESSRKKLVTKLIFYVRARMKINFQCPPETPSTNFLRNLRRVQKFYVSVQALMSSIDDIIKGGTHKKTKL